MKVRSAKIADAKTIHILINSYGEQDRMLFRSLTDIYENLQTFIVAESDGAMDSTGSPSIVGCCGLQIIWSDLAEIRSLAVKEPNSGAGAGKMLVAEAIERAKQLGIQRIFALTLEPEFFEKLGFERVEKSALPMKVWRDCARCSKQQNCDEVAVVKNVVRGA
ncbi:MAG: N-acetyltransferase [Sedimentisphaerales bacterium]|nr:N-acetyltransferase [Sedimentisphaerales bacterium]